MLNLSVRVAHFEPETRYSTAYVLFPQPQLHRGFATCLVHLRRAVRVCFWPQSLKIASKSASSMSISLRNSRCTWQSHSSACFFVNLQLKAARLSATGHISQFNARFPPFLAFISFFTLVVMRCLSCCSRWRSLSRMYESEMSSPVPLRNAGTCQ